MSEENEIKPVSIPKLVGHNFFIPDYQRGYRWEKDQIQQLLKDLWDYFKSQRKGFYCLQPIIVKKCSDETIQRYGLSSTIDNNTWYEVIDGQQRLTSIRILLSFYQIICNRVDFGGDETTFKIQYETRPKLGQIFEKIKLTAGAVWSFDSSDIDIWVNAEKIGIDVEYVKNVAESIINWFVVDANNAGLPIKQHSALSFFSDLYNEYSPDTALGAESPKSVVVLWYEIKENVDGRLKFEEINDLTVKLSSSELVRALFLSEATDYKDEHESEYPNLPNAKDSDVLHERLREAAKEKKQLTIKAQWDEIEHRLHNDKFWNFLTSRKPSEYRNRIELLMDIMSQKFVSKKNSDPLFTYVYFLKQVEQTKDPWRVWNEIYDCYSRLLYWSENRNYYHKIGYLSAISANDAYITDLLDKARTKNKDEFDKNLIDKIRTTIVAKKDRTDRKISDLDYQDKNDYGFLKNILLLYNVEYTNQTPAETDFPFGAYRKEKNWSLEHIHAQNSECLNPQKKDEWLEWMRYCKEALENRADVAIDPDRSAKRDELVSSLNDAYNKLDRNRESLSYEDITQLFDQVVSFDLDDSAKQMHQISNLALLSQGQNSAIGKSPFDVKRQILDRKLAKGEYIPVCTKKVFQKSYCDNSDQSELQNTQRYSWDAESRKLYFESIKQMLGSYIADELWEE